MSRAEKVMTLYERSRDRLDEIEELGAYFSGRATKKNQDIWRYRLERR